MECRGEGNCHRWVGNGGYGGCWAGDCRSEWMSFDGGIVAWRAQSFDDGDELNFFNNRCGTTFYSFYKLMSSMLCTETILENYNFQ